MLRINLEITRNSRRLEQIGEIAIVNQGHMEGRDTVYWMYKDGEYVAELLHRREDGALALAHLALGVLVGESEG